MKHYKNNPLEDLHRLTEAVQASHTDIAPTYLEYTQLAFAIATDCGEAGRTDFITLCSLSPKHDSEAAEKLFSNALRTCKGDIHLGSVFHLAERRGVRVASSSKNADADAVDAVPFFSHTCARYNKVENEEEKEWEEEENGESGTKKLRREEENGETETRKHRKEEENEETETRKHRKEEENEESETRKHRETEENEESETRKHRETEENEETETRKHRKEEENEESETRKLRREEENGETETRKHRREENEKNGGNDRKEEERKAKGTEPLSPLPCFPQDCNLPEPLNSILSFGKTPEQRDVLLLGAMTVLGASLSHNVRCMYGNKWQYPCMQTFVTGHAATGKSVLVWVRKLIEPLHEEIRRQVEESMKAYRREQRAYESLGKARKDVEQPVPPPNRMFIIPGNNTGTGLLQNLIDSGGTGIICESEADTVSAAIGTEFGNWSDTLRKAFDHDRLSYNRRTDREYRETTACYLSVLLSGTPAQISPLISSPENGQFSRNIFYYMPRVNEWRDQFDEGGPDVEEEFRRMGREWKGHLDELKKKGLFTLKFTTRQQEEFNGHFSDLFHRSSLVTGEEMTPSVMRMGIILCRMMCVTALLRSLEILSLAVPDPTIHPENLKDGIITRYNLSITDEDFHAILALCEPLYVHATHILSFLNNSTELNSRGTADREMLYAALPQEFTLRTVREKAEELNIPDNTARSWIQRMRCKGALDMVRVKGKGIYLKKQGE